RRRSSSASTRWTTLDTRTAVPSTSARSSASPRWRPGRGSKGVRCASWRRCSNGRRRRSSAAGWTSGWTTGSRGAVTIRRQAARPAADARVASCARAVLRTREPEIRQIMTERLYYTDPYLREFDATLVDTVSHEGQTALVLDRTAFYPDSGGQPADAGAFGDVRVLDVVHVEDGRILHVVDRAPSATALHGTIDWTRRFDHMQQHTGQHVLSAAFARLLSVRTESFHMGVDYSTIDLAREVSAQEVARAQNAANRIVWEDRPVTIRFADADEAASMGLRKESKRDGTLRLIEIEDFDLSACGGTHVARTGAIGIIA